MAQARALPNPPIQEAALQFDFLGIDLSAQELERISDVYVAEGWIVNEIHTFETTFQTHSEGTPEIHTARDFIGFHLASPDGVDLVQIRGAQVSASTKKYRSWEVLMDHARAAFERYVELAKPSALSGLSARFINRIPPYAGLEVFDQVLTRPPVPLADLPGATISDFLRRHVVTGLQGGFSALLTIGTVKAEPDEDGGTKGLVIDTDVRKACEVEPRFDLLSGDLATLRSIKNTLFFGSLQDKVMERFQ